MREEGLIDDDGDGDDDDEVDPSEDGMVAIKKIDRAFEHRITAQRTLRELKI